MNLLVTGGAGFIGSNFVRLVLRERPGWSVVNLDKLTYAGNAESLADLNEAKGFVFARGDIANRELVDHLVRGHGIEAIVNFAAESHVDRSILGPAVFVETNVVGTQVLLDAAREHKVRFVQVSTDEVYGSLGAEGKFTEDTPLAPNSPYASSKAAADLLVRAYHHTFGLDALVTRCSNNYGPYQFPEKLIPLMIVNALGDKELPVYGDGMQVRDWIHVEDHCAALLAALERGAAGRVYNIGAESERPNIDVVRRILAQLGKPETLVRHVTDRQGHDRRYAIDASRARAELGWRPAVAFDEGLERTVRWYLDNRAWWSHVQSGEYLKYYQRQYGAR